MLGFDFIDPSTQLLSMLISGAGAIMMSLAVSAVYFVRFYRSKNKRQLWHGLIFALCVPILVALAVYGGCWRGLYNVDKETIKERNFLFSNGRASNPD